MIMANTKEISFANTAIVQNIISKFESGNIFQTPCSSSQYVSIVLKYVGMIYTYIVLNIFVALNYVIPLNKVKNRINKYLI